MNLRLAERLTRLEHAHAQGGGDADGETPPGMIAVLMYGIAVHLGGFPGPVGARGPHLTDTVADAFARGLGCADDPEMRVFADRPGEWATRFGGAVSRLLDHLGLDETQFGSPEAFRAFVRMLDEFAVAKATWGRAHGWENVGDALDQWIRHAGHSPETIRSEARQ